LRNVIMPRKIVTSAHDGSSFREDRARGLEIDPYSVHAYRTHKIRGKTKRMHTDLKMKI